MYDLQSDDKKSKMIRTRDVCCILVLGVIIFALGVVGGIFIGIYAYHGGPDGNESNVNVECISKSQNDMSTQMPINATTKSPPTTTTKEPSACDLKTCPKRNAHVVTTTQEVFTPLSEKEMKMVRDFLIDEGIVTNKIGDDLSLTTNYIANMDLSAPRKETVLQFLDRNSAFPGRYARVMVVRGARSTPDMMIYTVGPIGQTGMKAEALYADGEIAFEVRPIDFLDIYLYGQLLKPVETILEPLVKESFDGANFNGGGLAWWPYEGPPGPFEKQRETKVHAYFSPLDEYGDLHLLDMLPLSAVIHCPGNNVSSWYVYNFYYLNQGPFATAQELVDAYQNGTIRKIKLPEGYSQTIEKRFYVGRDDTEAFRANAQMPPPRTYEPMGPRYTVNGHRVQWMGWSFDVTSRMMRGGAIYDVRYKNQRIAYEISLNEIALIYASDSFERSNVVYTDSTYAIGINYGVLKGVDCPEHASILETTFYDAYSGGTVTSRSICLFESDGESAAWRHKYSTYQAGLRQNYLVVRLSATVVNYDYIVDYEFHLDGKIYVKVKATGFIQTSFWDPGNPNRDESKDSGNARDSFGFRVTDYGHGIIHDHMFGFKVDLDILDTNNSFEVIHFKAGDVVDAFKAQNAAITAKPDYFTYNYTRYLEYETVQTERGYKLDPVNPKFWTIVNENYRNRWGAKRGYQLLPLTTTIQNMVDAHPAMQALSFTKNTCVATKYKDTEPFLSSLLDGFRFDNSMEDLEKQLNGEDIVNEDIVNWMTVGFLHIPTAEDVPMTVTLETGFGLKPFNFFDKTDVYDMPQYYNGVNGDMQKPPAVEPCLENDPNI